MGEFNLINFEMRTNLINCFTDNYQGAFKA